MPVHVGRVLTEVVAEPEPVKGPPPAVPWAEVDRLRSVLAALERDRLRTRAEGFDD